MLDGDTFVANGRRSGRYQEIFGGELTLMAMKDVPGEEPPADKADMIIHAAVTIGDEC